MIGAVAWYGRRRGTRSLRTAQTITGSLTGNYSYHKADKLKAGHLSQ